MSVVVDGTAGVTFPDTSVQSVAKPAAPQSFIWLTATNGYGSTNTTIKRYSTTVTNQGSDITYTDSATLGAAFTINTNGVYAISIIANAVSGTYPGISVNSSQLSTVIYSITASNRLGYSYSSGGNSGMTTVCVYLSAGSVIRPHTDGAATTVATVEQFQIVRVA
jgi:hypothetical protein